MSPSRESAFRLAILAGLFLLGITIGTIAWDEIVLPFKNPWGVVGLMPLSGYNPANDIVRFVAFVLAPPLLLMVAYLVSRKRLRGLLFKAPLIPSQAAGAEPGAWIKLLLIAFSVIVAMNSPVIWGELDTFHEGETLGTVVSYEAGLVPYKDFLFAHGIYQDPLRSLFAFKLFGRSIGAVRSLENIHNALAFILIGLFALMLFRGRILIAFAAVLSSGLFWFFNFFSPKVLSIFLPPFIISSELAILAFIIAGLSIYGLAARERPAPAKVLLSGFFFSFIPVSSFAYSVDKGFFLLAAFVILAPVLYFCLFRQSAIFLISLISGALSGAVLLLFLLKGGTAEFMRFVFLIMPGYKELMDGIVYPLKTPSAFLACSLCAFNAFWLTKRFLGKVHSDGKKAPAAFAQDHFPELMIFLLSIFIFRSALGRSDLIHIASSIYLTYILFVYILLRYSIGGFLEKPGVKRAVSVLGIIIVASASSFGVWRIHAADLIRHNFPINVKDEEFIPKNYSATVDFLKANLNEGETFFTFTSEAIWYYFLNQPSATRFPTVWFGAPLFYQNEIIKDLEKNKVKYIIYTNSHWSNFIDGVSIHARLNNVDNHVRERYRFEKRIYDNEIWIRKDASEEALKTMQ